MYDHRFGFVKTDMSLEPVTCNGLRSVKRAKAVPFANAVISFKHCVIFFKKRNGASKLDIERDARIDAIVGLKPVYPHSVP